MPLVTWSVSLQQSAIDAQCLANQINMYYLGSEDAFALVKTFNHNPSKFDHQKLIDRLENLTGAPTVWTSLGSSRSLSHSADQEVNFSEGHVSW